jgi:hypothetical protein
MVHQSAASWKSNSTLPDPCIPKSQITERIFSFLYLLRACGMKSKELQLQKQKLMCLDPGFLLTEFPAHYLLGVLKKVTNFDRVLQMSI